MEILSLNGKWELCDSKHVKKAIPAQIPGTVHTDLMNAGVIEDPFYRDNELKVLWIEDRDWIYKRIFDIESGILEKDCVLLRCKGLDTLAEIKINGKKIASTDNMFRAYEFDVKKILKEGKNNIEIKFSSVFPYLDKKKRVRDCPGWLGNDMQVGYKKRDLGNWLRKEQCNFGWDWGPALVTCGIWKDIEITAFDKARIKDVEIRQELSKKSARLDLNSSLEKTSSEKFSAKVYVEFNGKTVAGKNLQFKNGKGKTSINIDHPELWWPNGMGKQNLYDVKVELYGADSKLLDVSRKRIGLRKIELVRENDKWGESFYFAVNGKAFFAKGANWIPSDSFITRMTEKRYRHLIKSAKDANMNILRVWGGGIYENDVFYDLCDEMGLCVWQDFMFACATYPSFDKDFMNNVEIEVEQNIKRLRHHPCIAIWCGNNELEQGLVGDKWSDRQMSWSDYGKLFDKLLKKLMLKYSPETPYWPGSPHSPKGDRKDFNSPKSGDAHLWSVWHGRQPFEWYRTSEPCRFVSEFGFQSFPEPKTVYGYTVESDRNFTSWVMDHHQRAPIGNSAIMSYMLDWFKMPKNFESALWMTQILQGMAITYAVEAWRRAPQCMGAIYWQLNDCWPVASWASIDYHGRWKALQYMAKRFFEPLHVSIDENWRNASAEIFVSNDLPETADCRVNWTLTDVQGKILEEGSGKIKVSSGKTGKAARLNFKTQTKKLHARNLMLWTELVCGEKTVSNAMATFYKPKSMELEAPRIKAKLKKSGNNRFSAEIGSNEPALWAWLELDGKDAVFSDNFFHVRPGKNLSISFEPSEKMNLKEVEKRLIIRSFKDLY